MEKYIDFLVSIFIYLSYTADCYKIEQVVEVLPRYSLSVDQGIKKVVSVAK